MKYIQVQFKDADGKDIFQDFKLERQDPASVIEISLKETVDDKTLDILKKH